jgi:hypothetical protein
MHHPPEMVRLYLLAAVTSASPIIFAHKSMCSPTVEWLPIAVTMSQKGYVLPLPVVLDRPVDRHLVYCNSTNHKEKLFPLAGGSPWPSLKTKGNHLLVQN